MKTHTTENLDGWLLSEKLDGVKAYWTGREFLYKSGRKIVVPGWFARGLPAVPLDGELWLGRGRFDELVSVLQRPGDPRWREVRYVVYDAIAAGVPFASRLESIPAAIATARYAVPHQHCPCKSLGHLRSELSRVLQLGGEGLCARDPRSADPDTVVKIKPCQDAEGIVVGWTPGKHADRIGALIVQIESGAEILIGAGLSNAEREEPPAIGAVITYRYRGLSKIGRPLQATYWRPLPAL